MAIRHLGDEEERGFVNPFIWNSHIWSTGMTRRLVLKLVVSDSSFALTPEATGPSPPCRGASQNSVNSDCSEMLPSFETISKNVE
jgi:hypothetical protein